MEDSTIMYILEAPKDNIMLVYVPVCNCEDNFELATNLCIDSVGVRASSYLRRQYSFAYLYGIFYVNSITNLYSMKQLN